MKKLNWQSIIQGVVGVLLMVSAVISYKDGSISNSMLWALAAIGFILSSIISAYKFNRKVE